MPDNNDFTFSISVSEQNFPTKLLQGDSAWGTITFKPQELTVKELLQAALDGKVFCAYFKSNQSDSSFTITEKKRENFLSTSTLFYDFDNMDVDMDTFIDKVQFKPSFAYTTYDNGVGDCGYRYRLGYVFLHPIVGESNFNTMYNAIIKANGFEFEKDKQKGGLDKNTYNRCELCYLGTNRYASIYYTPYSLYIYTQYDFEPYMDVQTQPQQESNTDTSTSTKKIAPEINGDILDDIRNLKFDDFFHKYAPQYYNNYKASSETPLILDESEMFFRFPKEYYAVKHNTLGGKTVRWKKKSDRKKKMFFTAKIMLNNLPSLTIDNLLFNLFCERAWYYDNTDNKLSNDVLIETAQNAYTYDYPLKQYKHPSFRVNKPFWQEQGITAKQAANHIRGYLHVKEVERYFNPYISIKQNVEIMKNNGIKVSKRTLQRMVTQGDIQIDKINKRNSLIHYLSERREDVTNAIIDMIREDGTRTQQYYADLLNVDLRTIKRYFSDMKGKYIEREGNNRTGRWVVIEHQQQNVPRIEEPYEMTKIS